MLVSRYSVLMAVLWFTAAALLGSLMLRKAEKYGLVFVGLAFLFAFLRGIFPIDLETSIVIRSETIYPMIRNLFDSEVYGGITIGQFLLMLWGVGAAVQLLRLVRKLLWQARFLHAAPQEPSDSELTLLLGKVCGELHYSGRFRLSVSPQVSTAYQAGFWHPHILLPVDACSFSEEDLRNMFRHELCHFLGGDLWIKLSIQVMACFMWWNPVMPLLNRNIAQLLELICDRRACKGMTKAEQLEYLDRLLQFMKSTPAEVNNMTLSYLGNLADADVRQRFQLMLQDKTSKQSRIQFWGCCLLCAALFVASYFVILQPGGFPPLIDEEGPIAMISSENVYIVRTQDGVLWVYYENEPYTILPEDGLSYEPFCNLPIYIEESDKS